MCLILSKNRTACRYAVVKKSTPQNSRYGGKFSQLLLLFLISFLGFNNTAFSQCNPDNTAPVAACITAITVSLDSNGFGSLTVQDVDNGSTDFCGIAAMSLSQSMFTCADLGFVNISLTVTDMAGNGNSCPSSVLVRDVLAPDITCPPDVIVDCGDPTTIMALGNATVIDNCDQMIAVTNNDVMIATSMGNCMGIERTFTVVDNFMNDTSCVQIIQLIDNVAPVLDFGMGVVPPQDTTLNCMEAIPMPPMGVTMTDNCAASQTINVVEVNNQLANSLMCGFYNYTIVRTWTAADDCGNTTVHTQVISIENEPMFTNTAPTTEDIPAISSFGCPDRCSGPVVLDLNPYLTYNCGIGQLDSVSYSLEDLSGSIIYSSGNSLFINSVCLDAGVYNAHFSATDFCGNTTTHTVVVTIEDNLAPNANCFSNINVTVPATGQYIIDPINDLNNNSTDNCASQLIFSVDTMALDCTIHPIGSMVTVVMTVSDGTNSSTCPTVTVSYTHLTLPTICSV